MDFSLRVAVVLAVVGAGAAGLLGRNAEARLLEHLLFQVESRLPKDGQGEMRQFEFWNQTAPPPKRLQTWLGDVDLSFICAGVESPEGAWERRGNAILVTPRHVLMASHHRYATGDVLIFVDRRGSVVRARLRDEVEIEKTDITLGLLEWKEQSTGIVPACLVTRSSLEGALAAEKVRTIGRVPLWVPVLGSNRDRKITLQVLRGIGPRIVLSAPASASTDLASWQPYYIEPQSGTSGSPLFWLINGKVALLGHYSTVRPDSGPFYGWYLREIEGAIAKTTEPGNLLYADLDPFLPGPAEAGKTEEEGQAIPRR